MQPLECSVYSIGLPFLSVLIKLLILEGWELLLAGTGPYQWLFVMESSEYSIGFSINKEIREWMSSVKFTSALVIWDHPIWFLIRNKTVFCLLLQMFFSGPVETPNQCPFCISFEVPGPEASILETWLTVHSRATWRYHECKSKTQQSLFQ